METYTQVPDWILERGDLSHGAKLLWSRIRRARDNRGIDWYAAKLAVSRYQIIRYKAELLKAGLLIEHKTSGLKNRYEPVADTQPVANVQPVADTHGTSCRCATKPVADVQHHQKQETNKRRGKRFQKPSVEQVRAYCIERNNDIDPDQFIDHYTANGWRVGKNPMRDWKAAVRTWEKRNRQEQPKKPRLVI